MKTLFVSKISIYAIRILSILVNRPVNRWSYKLASRLKSKPSSFKIKTSDGIQWNIDTGSHVECMIAMDAMEPKILKLIRSLNLENSWVVDMGANVGAVTLRLAKAVTELGNVISYEPNLEVAERLRGNLELNGFQNVHILHKGVWSSSGEYTMYLPNHNNAGTASIVDSASNSGGKEIVIQTESFDGRWDEMGKPNIRLVKIDIQGAEIEALQGMKSMLQACKPGLIIEVVGESEELPQRASTLSKILEPLGYRSLRILKKSLIEKIPIQKAQSGDFDTLVGDVFFEA